MKLPLDTDLETLLKVQQSLFSAQPVNPNATFQKSIMTVISRLSPKKPVVKIPAKKTVPLRERIAAVPRVVFPQLNLFWNRLPLNP